jgi:hypothetical protein
MIQNSAMLIDLNISVWTGRKMDKQVSDEIDAAKGWISIESPLARAALKKRIDDEFEAALPAGPARFIVVDVRYAP